MNVSENFVTARFYVLPGEVLLFGGAGFDVFCRQKFFRQPPHPD